MKARLRIVLLLVVLLAALFLLLRRRGPPASSLLTVHHRLDGNYNLASLTFLSGRGKTVEAVVMMGGEDPRRAFTAVDLTRGSPAVLTANPGVVHNGQNVTVSWRGVASASEGDWIGVYCPSDSDSRGYLDYCHVSECPTYLQGRGRVELTLYNMRMDCVFRYFTANQMSLSTTTYNLIAVSNVVGFVNGSHAPLHGHLALTGRASEMRVQWTSGSNDTPTVFYGTSSKEVSLVATGVSSTYSNTDMCGAPANSSLHFIDPGFMHNVLLEDLQPNSKYFYRFGSGRYFSELRHFTTGLEPGDSTPFSAIVYGDMDFTPAAKLVASQVFQEIRSGSSAFVAHVGDLSYACGMSYRWEQWMTLIEPYASLVAYMVNIGNHEQVYVGGENKDPSTADGDGFHPSWGNYGFDSGGECGIPTLHRFHMPDVGNPPWWYSYEYGLVHFTQMSSENNFTWGSQQYQWLESDLKSVNRERTPWLILTGHRPLYNSQNDSKEQLVALHLRAELEDLLHEYGVDLGLYGHYHSYQRSCAVYQKECCEDGTVHITVGTAGCFLDKTDYLDASWSRHYEKSYGYGKMSVLNRTALHWEYFRSHDGSLADSVWLTK